VGIDSLRKQKYDRLDAKRLARKLSVADQDRRVGQTSRLWRCVRLGEGHCNLTPKEF